MHNLYLEANMDNLEKKGIIISEKKIKDLIVKEFTIETEDDKNKYYTIYFNNIDNILNKELTKRIKYLLKPYDYNKVLIIGLGNHNIICDSLGIKCINNIKVTNHYNDFFVIPKIISFAPDVVNNTGIDSFNLIKMMVNYLNPNLIVIIDSLYTKEINHIGHVIEINDSGVIDKERIKNNKVISKSTFNIPIISIGVPTVLDIKNKYFTSIDCDKTINNLSIIISNVINNILIS